MRNAVLMLVMVFSRWAEFLPHVVFISPPRYQSGYVVSRFACGTAAGAVYRDIYVARYDRLYNETISPSNCVLPPERGKRSVTPPERCDEKAPFVVRDLSRPESR